MSDIREAYVQAVYFRRRAHEALAVVFVVAFSVGLAVGVYWR